MPSLPQCPIRSAQVLIRPVETDLLKQILKINKLGSQQYMGIKSSSNHLGSVHQQRMVLGGVPGREK